jgi:cytochrome c biogenesis protein CcdA
MGLAVLGSALWLGLMTSISPCPLATNIAAISFIARRLGQPRAVLLSGLLYVFGRTFAYLSLAVLILAGVLAGGALSRFLERYLNQILGPVLILVGMVLLGLLGANLSLNLAGEKVQERASQGGLWWAGVLGILFALSFCPVSAGLFFGGLLPLSAAHGSRLLLPALFGIGTALPVVAFAFLMAFGAQYVGKAYSRLTQIERFVRVAAGTIFVVAGIYYCLIHIYGIPLLGG